MPRERTVGVEIRPGRNNSGAGHESERRLHPDDAAELRRNSVRASIVGAQRGKRNSARDRHRGAGARAARRLHARGIVRIAHLSGQGARAVAVVRKIISGGLAEHNRARRAHARDLDRITTKYLWKQSRPLGVGRGGREAVHVVDRLREHGNAIERSTQGATPGAHVRVAGIAHRRVGQPVDRVQGSIPCIAAIERFLRYLSGAPITTRSSGLIVEDRAGERIGERLWPSNKWNGEERAQFAESFASGNGSDHGAENVLSEGAFGSGKREAGSGKREAGSGKREAESGRREAESG